MKLLRRAVAAALLAPVLVLAVTAWSFVGLRCRMTGMVSLATCCPTPEGDAAGSAGAPRGSLDEPGCCERIVVGNAKPAAAGGSTPAAAAPLPISATVSVLELPWPVPRVPTPVVDVDPPDPFRPPLRVLHRSLLI